MFPVSPPGTTPVSRIPSAPGGQAARFGASPATHAADRVHFGNGGENPSSTPQAIGPRILGGAKEAARSALNPASLLMDALWSGLFFGISALLTAGPGGLIAAPFIPVIIATSAAVRAVFGFMRGFSGHSRFED